MPGNGRRGTAAAALVLALGSTAVLSWAFSIFSEDKKKSSSKSVQASVSTSHEGIATKSAGSTPHKSNEASPSLSDAARAMGTAAAGYRPGKCDFLPESLFYPENEKRPSLVIENKSATQSLNSCNGALDGSYPKYEPLKATEKDTPSTAAHENDQRHDTVSPFQSPTSETIPISVSLMCSAPKFDSVYNQSFTKTSVSDETAVEPNPADFPVMRQKKEAFVTERLSQVESKITTFEETEPVREEMLVSEETSTVMTTSVSSKSLESASLRYPPAAKPGRVSLAGVDNSIDELDDSGGALEFEVPEVNQQSYASTKVPKDEIGETRKKPVSQKPQENDESTDNMVTTLPETPVVCVLPVIEDEEQPQLVSNLSKDDSKTCHFAPPTRDHDEGDSVDNSVPTLEDTPVTALSLEQDTLSAYIPHGDIRDETKPKHVMPQMQPAERETATPIESEVITPQHVALDENKISMESEPKILEVKAKSNSLKDKLFSKGKKKKAEEMKPDKNKASKSKGSKSKHKGRDKKNGKKGLQEKSVDAPKVATEGNNNDEEPENGAEKQIIPNDSLVFEGKPADEMKLNQNKPEDENESPSPGADANSECDNIQSTVENVAGILCDPGNDEMSHSE